VSFKLFLDLSHRSESGLWLIVESTIISVYSQVLLESKRARVR